MGRYKIDKRIGIILVFLIIFLIANNVVGFVIYPLLLDEPDLISDYNLRNHMISIGAFTITLFGRIAIAIWLYIEARRMGRSKLVWTAFGLFFGITAAILFFLIEVYNELLILKQRRDRKSD